MFQTVGNRNGVERKKIRMEEGEESREETWWDRGEKSGIGQRKKHICGLNVTIRLKVIKGSH